MDLRFAVSDLTRSHKNLIEDLTLQLDTDAQCHTNITQTHTHTHRDTHTDTHTFNAATCACARICFAYYIGPCAPLLSLPTPWSHLSAGGQAAKQLSVDSLCRAACYTPLCAPPHSPSIPSLSTSASALYPPVLSLKPQLGAWRDRLGMRRGGSVLNC